MIQNAILCVIDFSQSSLQAFKWSVMMSKKTEATLTVLFCYRLITSGDEGETLALKKNMEIEASRKFGEMEKSLVNDQPFSCEFISEVGFFPFRIEMYLKKKPIGLLVIASSIIDNFSDYKKMSFDQFLQEATIPVVIV